LGGVKDKSCKETLSLPSFERGTDDRIQLGNREDDPKVHRKIWDVLLSSRYEVEHTTDTFPKMPAEKTRNLVVYSFSIYTNINRF